MIGRLKIVRLLTALVLGAAGGAVAMTGTAYAAACPAGSGVTVVVNSSVSCDSNGGGSATSNFGDGGHSLSNYRGFVCSIDGYPDPAKACHSYAPANAYWALFWANGKGGGWVYSTSGAGSLNVPTGGWVAFKFQTSSSRSNPGVRPYTAPPAPAPKPKPAKPKAKPTTSAPSKPNASASASAKAGKAAKPSASASASASAIAPGETAASDEITKASNESSDGSGSMVWVGAALAALLVIGMGAAVWRRRLAGRQP